MLLLLDEVAPTHAGDRLGGPSAIVVFVIAGRSAERDVPDEDVDAGAVHDALVVSVSVRATAEDESAQTNAKVVVAVPDEQAAAACDDLRQIFRRLVGPTPAIDLDAITGPTRVSAHVHLRETRDPV
jgi:hypothetical protein